MIPYFQRLGSVIEGMWLKHSYNEEVFTQLVEDALEQVPPTEDVKIEDIVSWVFGPSQEFRQPHYTHLFGEPPIMLFQSTRFHIEALFWLSATTSIHEHSFSGIFMVLAGSSVHSHWCFAPGRTINSRMICGRLTRVSTEILRPGDRRPIHAGDRLIHQLFHLELPSVTIVIRTNGERRHLPQYTYLPPGLALDREDRDELRIRRLLLLDGMVQGHIDGLQKYARRLVEDGDLETVFYSFSTLIQRRAEGKLFEELYGFARDRHGEIVHLFRRVCEQERRTRIVTALRSKIHDPGARFLLALLMLMPDRDAIFQAIQLEVPEADPLVFIEMWLAGISGKETVGFEFNSINRLIFRGLIEGLDEHCLLQRLRAELPDESFDGHCDRLLDHAKKMARLDLFFPLFSKCPLRDVA